MTVAKDLKRIVRSRMKKTGEAYTAARLQILTKPDLALIAGMSDASLQKATGRTWAEWVAILDDAEAMKMDHPAIAKLVATHGTPSWWTQGVTVGYERIRGLRARGQRRSGFWEATKSRTFPVSVATLFAAFKSPAKRRRWLDTNVTVRSSTAPKAMRLSWPDGTAVVIGFTAKGPSKSSVAIQHEKLASKDEADRMKAYWAQRFDALAGVLG